ncbi:type III-B CRISPR module RAMP protein Cmr6 [Clostridium sp. DMHC 10]|uniref:type III-B CRISPR module RAMP protein Cmr6 n=1 Tax=Clostridium sp. DMHC 10 TaxID=747377 RepID=UPI00069FCECC|nr:type III-B CRISPR module RAMP protein Cmr6 [Clostridium sp. DMHC 10]
MEADKDRPEMKEYHVYRNMMNYLYDNQARRKDMNKSLLINKFTNVFNLDESYCMNENERTILKNIKNNNNSIKDSLNEKFYCISFKGKVNDKLIVGLGNQSVFETGITLHHTYGIPYIPGQAIKGILRNYVIQEYFDSKGDSDISKEEFLLIFGGKLKNNKNLSGKVIFMDSFPCNDFQIKRDIMTPHYGKYYNGEIEPLDSEEPNPIPFLVVEKNKNEDLLFQFNIAIDKSILNVAWEENDQHNKKTIEEFVIDNFIDALNFHGIGAKTSVGYGYFDIDKEEVKKQLREEKERQEQMEKLRIERELKEAEELKRRLQEEEKLKKETEGMSSFEIKLYKLNQIKDETKKYNEIIKFYDQNVDILEDSDKIVLAKFVKKYFKEEDKWEYKVSKKGKVDKKSKKVKRICEILSEKLPVN